MSVVRKPLEIDEFMSAELGFPMFKRHRTPVGTGRAIALDKIKKLRTRFEIGMSRPEAARQCDVTWQTVDRYYGLWGDVPKRKVKPARRIPWLRSEIEMLRQIYPTAPQGEIEMKLSRHPWLSICKQANGLGLKRVRSKVTSAVEVIRDLRAARERRGLTRRQLAHKIGLHPQFITTWERGAGAPRFTNLIKWCGALGVVLRIYDKDSLSVTPVTGRLAPRKAELSGKTFVL